MNKNIAKKVLFFTLPFILGIIVGLGGSQWTVKGLQFGKDYIKMSYLEFEIDEATKQYLFSSDIDTSIYALEHFISFSEKFYKENVIDASGGNKESKVPILLEKNFPFDLAVAHVRLGNLYEKKGDKKKADENFGRGLAIVNTYKIFDGWKGTGKEIKTTDNLRKFVDELDDRLRKKETNL